MSSIPLPALSIHAPEQPDLMGQVGNLMRLKQLAGQQQVQQQQIVAGQQENDQRAMQIKSQKALMRGFQEANGDPDKAVALAQKYGAMPSDILKLKQAGIEQQKQAIELVNMKGARAVQEADLMKGAHDAVAAAKPEDRPQVYAQQLQGLQQMGVDISKAPPQYPGDEQFKFMGAGVQGHKQLVEEAAKQAGISKDTAQANEADAQTEKIKQETQNGPSGPAAEAKYRNILGRLSAHQEVSDQDVTFAKGFEASNKKVTTQSDSLGVTSSNTSGPAGLASVRGGGTSGGAPGAGSPQSTKNSIVDMVGQYKLNPTMLQRLIVKHPDVVAAVNQKYPDWKQEDYNASNKLMTNYTSGPQSKEINSINTAMGHIKNLDDAIDALNNGNLTMLNKIGAAYNINVAGKTPEAAFKLIVNRVGPEISSAYIPGGGGEKERIANQEDFNVNLPPQTLHNNASITVNMLRSKIGALENQYKNTVRRDDFTQRFITPEAQASLDKMAPKQGGGAGQAQQSAAPEAVGPDGHKIVVKNGKWVDAITGKPI